MAWSQLVWLSGLGLVLQTKQTAAGSIPVALSGHVWGWWVVSPAGARVEGSWSMFLSLSFSFPSPLSTIKKRKEREKWLDSVRLVTPSPESRGGSSLCPPSLFLVGTLEGPPKARHGTWHSVLTTCNLGTPGYSALPPGVCQGAVSVRAWSGNRNRPGILTGFNVKNLLNRCWMTEKGLGEC